MHRTTTLLAASAATLLGCAALLTAGPLSPPAGPVASTYKTLTDVEPRTPISSATTPGDASATYRISSPGSYYLTGNLVAAPGKSGIVIDAVGVTLDLRGFSVIGDGSPNGSAFGIIASAGRLAVRDGAVQNWPAGGIFIPSSASNCRFERVVVAGNRGPGMSVGNVATVTDCVASGNSLSGFEAGTGSIFTRCTASGNATGGLSSGPQGNGFTLGQHNNVRECIAYSNGRVGAGGSGFSAEIGSVFERCIANENGTSTSGDGFTVGPGVQISECTAELNAVDGIRAAGTSTIRHNTCVANGNPAGAGIHITSVFGLIADNFCANNTTGYQADQGHNTFARNFATNNGANWNLVALNNALVVVRGASPAISGNTGGTAIATSDPTTNVTLVYP